jgi:hypothetical protein
MIAAVLGWVGTIGLLATYLLVSRGRLAVSSLEYASMNAFGGLLAGTASALYGAWPSAAANYVWAVVGIHTLALCLRRKLVRRQALSPIHVVPVPCSAGVGTAQV